MDGSCASNSDTAAWPWVNNLTSLCLSFPVYKMKIIIVPASLGGCDDVNICKAAGQCSYVPGTGVAWGYGGNREFLSYREMNRCCIRD